MPLRRRQLLVLIAGTPLAACGSTRTGATAVVVGHQPFMSVAASLLLGCSISSFATGAAYCLNVASLFPHQVELEWRWPGEPGMRVSSAKSGAP